MLCTLITLKFHFTAVKHLTNAKNACFLHALAYYVWCGDCEFAHTGIVSQYFICVYIFIFIVQSIMSGNSNVDQKGSRTRMSNGTVRPMYNDDAFNSDLDSPVEEQSGGKIPRSDSDVTDDSDRPTMIEIRVAFCSGFEF